MASGARGTQLGDALPPRVLQSIGIVGVCGLTVFWAFTDRVDPAILATFGGLIGLGQTIEALTASRFQPRVLSDPAPESVPSQPPPPLGPGAGPEGRA